MLFLFHTWLAPFFCPGVLRLFRRLFQLGLGKKMRLVFYFCLLAGIAWGQSGRPLGLTPQKMRWQYIDTDSLRLVFPENLGRSAQRAATLLHLLYRQNTPSIGSKRKKVTVILQNQNIISNGFVALSPFRSEFYMNAPQYAFLGAGNWADLLALHEYRHVLQMSNAQRGVSKLVSWFFGENGWALMKGLALPRWFLEGDAIATETALSKAGRGRLPNFHKAYRALWRAGKRYGYEKAAAGSMKDFVPSHYHLGYYLTAFARKKYGPKIWQTVLEDAAKYKGVFFPFSRNLRKKTGLSTPALYRAAMQAQQNLWQKKQANLKIVRYDTVPLVPKKYYTDYRSPRFLDDTTLIVRKGSMRSIEKFYRIHLRGSEKALIATGINISEGASYGLRKGKIVWAQFGTHPRWHGKNYSVLNIYDFKENKKRQITHRSRLFSPDFSPDGEQIVAVGMNDSLTYRLCFFETESGSVLGKLPNPAGYFYRTPRWMDAENLLVVVQKNNRNALAQVHIKTAQTRLLTPWLTTHLAHPFVRGEYVYFSAAFSEIQNMYALRLSDSTLYRLTFSDKDIFDADISPSGKQMVFSGFTANGHKLYHTALVPENWQPLPHYPEPHYTYADTLAQQEGGDLLDSLKIRRFAPKKYRKRTKIINIHSIQPFFFPPDYRFELQSDNTFSTLSAAAGLRYNSNEGKMSYYGRLRYGAFFPLFDLQFTTALRRNRLGMMLKDHPQNRSRLYTQIFVRRWTEQRFSAGIILPLNFVRNAYYLTLRLQGHYHRRFVRCDPVDFRFNTGAQNHNGALNAFSYRLRFSHFRKKASRQIHSRFGQRLDINYQSTYKSHPNKGSVFSVNTAFYFPSIAKTHSFYVNLAYQREPFAGTYLFEDRFIYPRGYPSILHDEIQKSAFNYSLPLFYPDVALGPLVFIKRIKINLFLDAAKASVHTISAEKLFNQSSHQNLSGSLPGYSKSYTSAGFELTFDFRAFRLLDMEMGIRYSHTPDVGQGSPSDHFRFLLLKIK